MGNGAGPGSQIPSGAAKKKQAMWLNARARPAAVCVRNVIILADASERRFDRRQKRNDINAPRGSGKGCRPAKSDPHRVVGEKLWYGSARGGNGITSRVEDHRNK